MSTIYIITITTGEYDSIQSRAVLGFALRSDAEAFRERALKQDRF